MRSDIKPEALYWASFNRFELRLPGQCVLDCSHYGRCDDDVAAWRDRIREQIERDNFPNRPTPDAIREELREYGAWEESELKDDLVNFERLIWIAACNISDEREPDCSDPVRSEEPDPNADQNRKDTR